MSTKKRYGWRPDVPDVRDHLYTIVAPKTLPLSVDLRAQCPKEISDQGSLGSCTANAIGTAVEFDLMHQNLSVFKPSRLFVYYNERRIEGTVNEDAGAMIRDGIKSLNRYGVCTEERWPYSDANPGIFMMQPPVIAYAEALEHRAISYQRIPRVLRSMQACLAAGFPFVFGFSVYESFESDATAATGMMAMPTADEALLGGHAVLAVGYDNATQCILVRNSWGASWGDGGYFHMPYDYILNENLADDFWTIRALRG